MITIPEPRTAEGRGLIALFETLRPNMPPEVRQRLLAVILSAEMRPGANGVTVAHNMLTTGTSVSAALICFYASAPLTAVTVSLMCTYASAQLTAVSLLSAWLHMANGNGN